MKRIVRKLPKKPSALLRLAVRDAKRVAKDKRYELIMGTWHSPANTPGDEATKVCAVCMAGSIMAKTLKENPDQLSYPEKFPLETRLKLLLVDRMRTGMVLPFELPGCNTSEQIKGLSGAMEMIRRHAKRHRGDSGTRAPWRIYLHAADRLARVGL